MDTADVAPATTTSEQDRGTAGQRAADVEYATRTADASVLQTAGQRHINVMWERTQQIIAIMVTAVTMLACVFLIYRGEPATAVSAFVFLSTISTSVMTTYFARTNHTKTGGVGANDSGR